MRQLQTLIFTGATAAEATDLLASVIADGSFAVTTEPSGASHMWITHRNVIPGAMQQAYYELHVTAWVEVP